VLANHVILSEDVPPLELTSRYRQDIILKVRNWEETDRVPAEPVFEAQVEAGKDRWHESPLMNDLREKPPAAGLWNMFLPVTQFPKKSPGLTNLGYACCAEIIGRTFWAAQTMNGSFLDNMLAMSRRRSGLSH